MRALKMSIVSSHWKLTMTIERSWSSSNYRGSCQRTQHQPFYGHLVQFSSVAQSCLTLCNPMDCSTPGLPVHHQLPECLKQIGKVKSSISGCLMSWPKKKKKKMSFWSVIFSYSVQQQQTISWSDYDMRGKRDFTWQPAQWLNWDAAPKHFLKPNLHQKKGLGHCLVVCCQSDPLQLSEFQRNHYIWQVCSADQLDVPKTAVPTANIVNRKGPVLLLDNAWSHVTQTTLQKLNDWATMFCLMCHIHLTSCQLTTTSSSILTTFCRENASTTSRKQKMLSKSLLNPKAWIFMLQE